MFYFKNYDKKPLTDLQNIKREKTIFQGSEVIFCVINAVKRQCTSSYDVV